MIINRSPETENCDFKPLTQESFELKNGRVENDRAETGGECFGKALAPFDGPKDVFAFLQIGINPAAKVMENPGDYRPGYAAGLVTIAVGDNQLLGGNNKVTGGGGFGFPIVDATVTIGGTTVVNDGKLIL
jgi:hypothetical protein